MEVPTSTNPLAESRPHQLLKAKEEDHDLTERAIPRIATYTPPAYTYVAYEECVKMEDHESGKKEGEIIFKRESRAKKIK